ncbi:MAG: glycosyltransferase, partial [Nanoarchaeota archaeon]|nr:glycosyltransferase [Nanoarchaeota archaeon]
MKILYGVQGVGNGHLTRSRILIKALKQRGHEVQVIFSGRAEEKFRFVEDFIPYDVYRGLSFATSNGRVDHLKTLKEIRPIQFIKDLSTIKIKDIDLIFSDFEPLTSRAARKHHIPSIGIGHQYAFLYNIPKTKNLLAQFILKNYAPVDVGIGLHWHDYDS